MVKSENSTILLKNNLEVIRQKLKEVDNLYKDWKFSQKNFYIIPTEQDFKVVKKYIRNVVIHLTNRCNAYCKVCYKNSSINEVGTDLTLEEIDYITKEIGRGKQIFLFGGEPTIRNDLEDIVRVIKKNGHKDINIYTNGWKLVSKEYVRFLKQLGIKRVYLTFDGFNSEFYKEFRSGEFELGIKLRALKNLMEEKVTTAISFVLAKSLNENEIINVLNFCSKLIDKGYPILSIGVYFATKHGRIVDKDYFLNSDEGLDIIYQVSKGKLNYEYLIEFKKFLINFFNILEKIGIKPMYFGEGVGALFKVSGSDLKEVIELKKLKKMNELIENRKLLEVFLELLKEREVRNLIRELILNRFNIDKALIKNKMLLLTFGNIHTESNFSGRISDTVDFEKLKDQILMCWDFFRSTPGSDAY